MIPYMVSAYGNPHSKTHFYGWEAEEAVEKARLQVTVSINYIDIDVNIGTVVLQSMFLFRYLLLCSGGEINWSRFTRSHFHVWCYGIE